MNTIFRMLMKGYNQMSKGDLPELTNFLKTNQGFKSLSWKIFHFKNDFLKKLDEHILEDEDNGKKQIHKMKKISNHSNSHNHHNTHNRK